MVGSKKRFLRVLNPTLNPLALRAARSGRGPFSLVEHIDRKSGRTFEAPLILAEVPGGSVRLPLGIGTRCYCPIRTKRFLQLNGALNPLTLRAAKSGRGPSSLVDHVAARRTPTFEGR